MIDPVRLPKAELHLHIEGTLEAEMVFALAARNGVTLSWKSPDELQAAYRFADLQAFLDLYYRTMAVLLTAADFHDLTVAYCKRAVAQGVRHAEIFFDPQAHQRRGVALPTVIDGVVQALREAERDLGLTSHLIACFLRDLSAESAMQTLEGLVPFRDRIVAVGLDSAEVGNPPSKFRTVFDRARAEGFLTVAHAGEEGPPEYIWEALDVLHVSRIDHGVRSLEDPTLVDRLVRQRVPLTVCPLSNVRLRVVPTLAQHPLKRMLTAGIVATCNSDDPAYFGGYVGDNLRESAAALDLDEIELLTLARNSFEASFIDATEKRRLFGEIEAFSHRG